MNVNDRRCLTFSPSDGRIDEIMRNSALHETTQQGCELHPRLDSVRVEMLNVQMSVLSVVLVGVPALGECQYGQ